MLTYLRQHVATTLAPAHSATLVTNGSAGLQADLFPCVARGTLLYLLDPTEQPAIGVLMDEPGAPWSLVVEVHPTRVTIAQRQGWGAAETIDLE